jgi:carboxymethylenebutenolidase
VPDIEFRANGSVAPGYLAEPAGGSGPGVVVMQEWWGLDDHIRSVCDRFASEGFVALAPDLYRGEVMTHPDEARQRMMALQMSRAERDMSGAVDRLRAYAGTTGSAVAAVGFCLGGGLAVWAAAQNPAVRATVTFYYVMPHGTPDFSRIGGPVLGHFGTADKVIPVEAAGDLERRMRAAGCDVTFDYYDGAGHAFFNDTDRLGTYDEQASRVAWDRTVRFLREHLA